MYNTKTDEQLSIEDECAAWDEGWDSSLCAQCLQGDELLCGHCCEGGPVPYDDAI